MKYPGALLIQSSDNDVSNIYLAMAHVTTAISKLFQAGSVNDENLAYLRFLDQPVSSWSQKTKKGKVARATSPIFLQRFKCRKFKYIRGKGT
jgi:hypothetical protein